MTKEEIIKKAKIMWNDFHTPKEVMEFVFDEAEKEFNKKIEELERYYIRKKWIRPNTWELFYPDGTSRLMNFNPLEEQRKKFKKKIERFENKLRDNHFIMSEELLEELKRSVEE